MIINKRYRVEKKLGSGGMGVVYLVHDTYKGNMPFALKTIRHEIIRSSRATGISAFKNEYEIMTRLKHPNLTRVYDFGEDDENYFIIMEYLKGPVLSSYAFKNTREKLDIIVQILRALNYIHSRNIVYRDLKPGNIIIINDMAKLMDFGLSRSVQTEKDRVRGSLLYMAPEAFSGNISFYTDIFSLGIVFYELLTDSRFYAETKAEISANSLLKLISSPVHLEAHQKLRLSLIKDTGLRKIIKKMTAFHEKDRYSICCDIIEDININTEYHYEFETPLTRKSFVLGNPFANRTEEMSMLKENMLSSVLMIIIKGPSGSGKTRLLLEFKKYCRLNDMAFFDTTCSEKSLINYHSIGEILSQFIAYTSCGLLQEYGKYLKTILPDNQNLKDIAPIEIKDDPRSLQDIIIQNISDLIISFSKAFSSGIILCIDDLQWIDQGSLLILKNLLYRINILKNNNDIPGIVIYSAVNAGSSRGLFENENILFYDLHPLNEEGAREFIENIFGTRHIDKTLWDSIREIREKVGGNPFFLQELLNSLVEKEIIVRDRKYWRLLGPVKNISIPSNIIEIIDEKVNRLFKDDNNRKILKLLSMLRIDLDDHTIKSIINNIAQIDTSKVLLELENQEIIKSTDIGNEVYYSFNSNTIKDHIRNKIDNKPEISLFLAQTLDKTVKPGIIGYTEEIAFHYLMGGDEKNSMINYEKCGDIAKENFFNESAVGFYNTALKLNKLLSPLKERTEARIKLKIGDILFMTGQRDQSRKHYEDAIALSKTAEDHKSVVDGLCNLGILFHNLGDEKEAVQILDQAMLLAKNTAYRKGYSYATGNLGLIYKSMGDFDKSMACYEKQLKIFKEIGDKNGISLAVGRIGLLYWNRGEYDLAMENLKKELAICEESENKKGISYAVGNLGNVYWATGNISKAIECYETKLEICKEIGDKTGIGYAVGNMGVIYNEQGNYEEAMKFFTEALKKCEELGDKRGISVSIGNMGIVYDNIGDYSKAVECFLKQAAICLEIGHKLGIGYAKGNLGKTCMNKKDFEKALKLYDGSLIIMKELGNKSEVAWLSYRKADLLLQMSRTREADLVNNEALEIALSIKKTEVIFYCTILRHKISKNTEALSLMLNIPDYKKNEYAAVILYELWKLTKKRKYASEALQIYTNLFNNIKKAEYSKRITELTAYDINK